MPIVTLPDNSERSYDAAISIEDIAKDIGPGLAKAAIAGRVDDQLVDTSYVIDKDAKLAIITAKDDTGLEIIRHSTAHLLAQAVKRLFPSAQVTIGPVIEDGFYYDFAFERAFTTEDLTAIEDEMAKIVGESFEVTRDVMERDDAIKFFRDMGEEYKAKIIEDIPAGETLSLYRQGEFIDLCRGPHAPNTSHLKVFKLTKVSGAYWRGDANNEMLQRIYGTAWADKKALKQYLFRIEEAQKRDHRKIAKQLDLFHIQEEAPGMVFWHDAGWTIYQVVQQFIRQKLREHDYEEIKTPQIVDRVLWERSGHWENFSDEMFITASEDRDFAIKPMSCPCHIQVFNQGIKSYRDLPIRMSEFGSCHRNEMSGALQGLMRVRGFVQDDAHIFCTEEQIQQEAARFLELVFEVYKTFGFDNIMINLSTRPDKRVGSDELWDTAEGMLETVLNDTGIDWKLQPGEGAFYGPKIDFSLKDCLGRVWQCGTLQLDFSMPNRLGASYISEGGDKRVPVMLHRAILGSFERFIGILIEHHAGFFPPWLAPKQVAILNITDNQSEYAKNITKSLKEHGFRVTSDLRNEKIGFKIRESTLKRIPYLLIVGDKEVQAQAVAVRTRAGEDLGSMPLSSFIERLSDDIAQRG